MMTETTKQALREWTVDRLQGERDRIKGKRDEFRQLAKAGFDAALPRIDDCNDWLQAISNELTRRATVEAEAA